MINLLTPCLVGREHLMTALGHVRERQDLGGAIVFGGMGMGKSSLAAELLERGGAVPKPFLVRGTTGLSTLPYGVLAPLLSDVDEERLCTPLAVLRSVLAALRARSEGHRCVVVVDDVHLLDRESNHLLAQLVMSGAVHLLGFARSAADDLMDLGSLVDDAVLARFELAPLTPDDVAATCRHLLGGGIVRGASDYFTEKSGGNPLFLRSIVLHAVRSRCLVLSDGIYVLLNEPDEVDPALADLVAGDLRDVPALERDALDALSLAGAVPFILLSAMAGDAAVRRLLTSGLVRAAPWDPALAVVDPPMYAAVLSSLVTVGRRADLRARLLPVGTEFPPFGRGRISQLVWALDCGESVDDRVLLEAARVACTESTPQVALRLAEAVRSSGHAVAAAVEATRARSLLRRTTPAAAGVRSLIRMAPDDDSLGAAAVLSAQLELAATGQARGSLDIAEAWEEGLGRLHPHRSDDQVQENLRDVVLLRARALNLAGSFVESEQHLRKLLGAPLPQRQAVLGHALLGEALGATGRCVKGLDHLEAAMELVRQDRFGLGDIRTSVVGRHIPLLIHSGEYGRARTAISAYAAGDGRDFFFRSGTLAVWQGLLDVRVGRFTRAHDTLLHAVAALRQSDEDVMLPYALGLLCWTAAALGLIDVGLRLHQEFEFLAPRGSAAHLMAAKAYAAAARVRLEPVGDSDAELSALADGAATAGYSGCEKDILQLLVLLGERRHAPRLAQVTEHFEGAEAMLLHEYANALVNNDAGALVQIGDRAEQRGDYLLAVGASTHAVRLFAAQGDHKSQRHVCGVLRRRRALVEGAVVRNAGIEDLTDRESRIAVLAASGGTNRDIAEMLTVSPRTVEGHLYRMYLKLGITGRDELATVVESQVVESDN